MGMMELLVETVEMEMLERWVLMEAMGEMELAILAKMALELLVLAAMESKLVSLVVVF